MLSRREKQNESNEVIRHNVNRLLKISFEIEKVERKKRLLPLNIVLDDIYDVLSFTYASKSYQILSLPNVKHFPFCLSTFSVFNCFQTSIDFSHFILLMLSLKNPWRFLSLLRVKIENCLTVKASQNFRKS